jgi:transcriptional regulator with XRE-family HTH domain
MRIGYLIREARLAKNMTQEELAGIISRKEVLFPVSRKMVVI